MPEPLEIRFRMIQTTFRVIYGDGIELDADIIVSPDDTYFSASSGVSEKIVSKIGKDAFRREARKHLLPAALGSVLLSTGGKNLKAKYICHVATLDFNKRVDPQRAISTTVQRVIEIACALEVESIVTPILIVESVDNAAAPTMVSELTGQPIADLVELVLRNLVYYVATQREPISVQTITLALYQEAADNHTQAEERLIADLVSTRKEVARWGAALESDNTWIMHAQPLLAKLTQPDDKQLHEMIDLRLHTAHARLDEVLASVEHGVSGAAFDADVYEDLPLDEDDYQHQHGRLQAIIDELQEEIDPLEQQRKSLSADKARLEIKSADAGGDTELSLHDQNQKDALDQKLQEVEEQLAKPKEQLEDIKHQRALLDARWKRQQSEAIVDE